ncbi:MAG: hypothetical protein ACLRFI_02385 [Alphaproteobacteria bacterium]
MNKAIKFLLQTIITIMLSIEYGYADESNCNPGATDDPCRYATIYDGNDKYYEYVPQNTPTKYYKSENNTYTLTNMLIPAKNNFLFGGIYTKTNGNGTKYYDEQLTFLKTGFIDSSGDYIDKLYIKWNTCPNNGYCEQNELTCNEGYFKSENTCITCPANASCTQNGFTCDDKYYKHNNSCIQCPSNTNSNSDNSSCICGQDNFFNTQTGKCMTCPQNYECDGSIITGCTNGYFKYNDTCYPCNQNTMYCPNTDDQVQSPFTCKSGYYKGTNTTCDKCPTGMTSADRNTSNSATACYFNSSTTYNGNTFNSTKRDYGSKYNITFTQDQQSSQKN